MKRNTRTRCGIALIAALALLALLGLLIAGAVASTAVAQRTTRLALTDGSSRSAADYAIASVLADPTTYGLADALFGVPRTFVMATGASGGASAVATVVSATRLGGGVLWLVADAATSGVDQGHRRLNLIARFPSIGPLPPAGIVARGSVSFGDSRILADSSGDADCARPPADSAVQTSDSAAFYLLPWQAAVLDAAPGVVHVRGDTTIAAGSFTGVLLVDGALTVGGNWSANGLIVVRGPVRVSGNAAITGSLMSFATGTSVALTAGSIRYAPCIVAREIRRAIPPRTVAGRAWAELF